MFMMSSLTTQNENLATRQRRGILDPFIKLLGAATGAEVETIRRFVATAAGNDEKLYHNEAMLTSVLKSYAAKNSLATESFRNAIFKLQTFAAKSSNFTYSAEESINRLARIMLVSNTINELNAVVDSVSHNYALAQSTLSVWIVVIYLLI